VNVPSGGGVIVKRAAVFIAVVIAIAALAGCAFKANDPATAAKVLTQASFGGYSATAKAIDFGAPNFVGSAYEKDVVGGIGLTFTDQKVVQDGATYYLDGTLSFALDGSIVAYEGTFVAYVYGSGLHISGPDYEGDVEADFKETVTWSLTGSTWTMSCDVTGAVGGTPVAETVEFTFEMI
jgi:hypothetical protein